MAYTYRELVDAYRGLGLGESRLVYAGGELWRLMDFEDRGEDATCAAHLRALQEVMGPDGTFVVLTQNMNLCNTDIPFDPERTPSDNSGAFSEFVRRQPGALRSFHPFASMTALGPAAGDLVENISRHACGEETPWARFIEADGTVLSIGGTPSYTCNIHHHVEQMMGVPYRYVKEFIHPVVRNGEIVEEPFYRYVWYRGLGLKSNLSKKLFARLAPTLEIREVSVGRGKIYAYSSTGFYAQAKKIFIDDIYVWCEEAPTRRPYQE